MGDCDYFEYPVSWLDWGSTYEISSEGVEDKLEQLRQVVAEVTGKKVDAPRRIGFY